MLDYNIKCTCYDFTNIFRYLSNNNAQIERNGTCSFRKCNFFNNSRKGGTFGIDLVHSMLNTLQSLELANVSSLFTFTYEAIDKYVMQGPECV